jgi:ABC-type branched-subunit amino acid transport system substrate-binding protein
MPPPAAPPAQPAPGPGTPPGAPGPPPLVPAPDLGAEADFRDAKAKFDQGDREGARVALDAFVVRHPGHPSRTTAQILLARLALLRADAAGARILLEPLASASAEPTVASNARYYLGLAELRVGNAARARDLLMAYLPRAGAGVSDEALVELRGALAEATAATGDLAMALELWDGFFRGAKEFERAYARQRAEALAGQMSGESAWRAFSGAPQGGLARAVLGPKATIYLRNQSDASGAAFIESETAKVRRSLGFEESGQRVGPGDPSRIGLALPLSGKFQPIGEATVRAAMLATGGSLATPGGGQPASPQLVVRDTATEPDRAARGVAELTRSEGVIGIVGAADKKAGAAAMAEATQDGIPLLTLDDQLPGALNTAFQLIHSPEMRAAELARRALKLGVRDVAILGPDSGAGKRLREAFRRELVAGGGRITAEATYVAGATSFSAAVAAIKKPVPQAVFVPDGADRLELVAPALAVADLWPQPWGKPRPAAEPGKPRPRYVLLLSTANDLSPRLLQNAGRYVQGALLSPGFFADETDPRSRAFIESYRAAYGQDPRATEAYSYDGVALLRAVTEAGARTRADVLQALATRSYQGLTGDLRFGPDHARVDPPLVYLIEGDQIKATR